MSPAVVAVDDEHFWHHGAVDPPAIGRALLNGVAHPGRDPGGSTLTRQLAKVLYSTGRPARSPSWARSASPSSSSTATRRRASSPCTSTASTFGPGHWGIAQASRGYFGTSPDRLTWGEATLLAGLPQAPRADDPVLHRARARARQRDVLHQLVADHQLTSAQAAAAYGHTPRPSGR